MTAVVQFENNNWYAEGFAVMDDKLFSHPIMIDALERVAQDWGFDFVGAVNREFEYSSLHQFVDGLHALWPEDQQSLVDAFRALMAKVWKNL